MSNDYQNSGVGIIALKTFRTVQRRILWGLFFATVTLCVVVDFIGALAGWTPKTDGAVDMVRYSLSGAMLLGHVVWALGIRRGLFFLLLASLAGFTAEAISVNYITLFGGQYIYHGSSIRLLGVPLVVPLFWMIFIYLGYSVTSSLLCWLNREKPSRFTKTFGVLAILILLDGLFVVAIDMLLDPIYVRKGYWSWTDGGAYYGIPIGNFVGWFFVTLLATGSFRIFEYIRPRQTCDPNKQLHLLSGLNYGLLCLVMISWSLQFHLPGLALTGLPTMGPVAVVNLVLFIRWSMNSKKQRKCLMPNA